MICRKGEIECLLLFYTYLDSILELSVQWEDDLWLFFRIINVKMQNGRQHYYRD